MTTETPPAKAKAKRGPRIDKTCRGPDPPWSFEKCTGWMRRFEVGSFLMRCGLASCVRPFLVDISFFVM